MKKVQLFLPKSVYGGGEPNSAYWSPTLLHIASYAKQKTQDLEISIHEGELYPDNESLIKKLDKNTDIVGVSCNSFNYSAALEIAEEAKKNGAKTVLGGLHATYFKERVLENHSYVDAIIYGKGENPFNEYINSEDKSNVPNLIWRENGCIKRNAPGKDVDVDEIEFDYSLLELPKFIENHKRVYSSLSGHIPLSLLTHEGCAKREESGPCSFCSIQGKLKYREPKKVWASIDKAVTEYGFNIIRDHGDSLTGNKEYLKEIIETRPSHLKNLEFAIYNNISDIDQETIELVKKLNVKVLFAAIESGDDNILRNMNKGVTVSQMKKSIKLISENKIPIYTSYVLGERGETIESLENSLDFAKWTMENADVIVTNSSPMVILPGAPNYGRLLNSYPELKGNDNPDFNELKKLWVSEFCPDLPNYEILEEYSRKIGNLLEIHKRNSWTKIK